MKNRDSIIGVWFTFLHLNIPQNFKGHNVLLMDFLTIKSTLCLFYYQIEIKKTFYF